MTWWEFLLAGLAGLLASALAGVAYAASGELRARRAPARIRRGRVVAVPVSVAAAGVGRGRALADAEDLRVVTRSHHLVVARADVRAAGARRERFDADLFEVATLRAFTGSNGIGYGVGPAVEWEDAFEALLDEPARQRRRAARRWRLLAAAAPRGALALAAVAALATAMVQAVWWTGHQQRATVVAHIAHVEDGYTDCAVRWTEGSASHYAELDCYEPLPPVGAEVTVRALAWPFAGSAMDTEGSYEALTSLTAGPFLLALAVGVGVGSRRLRRPAVRLHPVVTPATQPSPDSSSLPDPSSLPDDEEERALLALPLRELSHRVAVGEGWAAVVEPAPPAPGLRQQLRMAAAGARWWPVFPLLFLALVADEVSTPWRAALVAGAGVLLVWAVVRTVVLLGVIRSPNGAAVSSEWDYQVVRTIDDDWVLLLLLGDTPHWSVVLPHAHPAAAGRCGIRGDLKDGGAVHVVVDRETWVPVGPVARLADDDREEIRVELVERLLGRPLLEDEPDVGLPLE